ncbi:hypothetical protein D3C87_184800 [compost metagenome]
MKQAIYLFFLSTICLFSACKKYEVGYEGKAMFSSYTLESSSNPDLAKQVKGVIEGDNVYIRVPNSVNISQAIPSFTVDDQSIVYIGNTVQQSGVTPVDLSKTVQYRIATPNDMSVVNVHALLNAAIVSFGFYAEDNDGVLFKNYTGTFNGLKIQVNLPTDADVSKLVARFVTTSGAVVKVGGVTQTSRQSSNDFTTSVTYQVTDAETTVPEDFVVSIGRLTAPEWIDIVSANLSAYNVAEVNLAINPTTNYPVIIFARSAVNNDLTTRKAIVSSYNGTTWNFVGDPEGISTGRVETVGIDIDQTGVIYAAYKDHNILTGTDLTQYASVQKYSDGNWSYLFRPQASAQRTSYLHIATTQYGTPIIGYAAARAEGGAANRSPQSAFFVNNSWLTKPIDASPATLYTRIRKTRDNKVYYAVMDGISTTRKPTLYRLNETTLNWEVVGTPLISPDASVVGAAVMDIETSENGAEVYLVFQSQANTNKFSYVMRYNGTSWRQIGDAISHTANSSGQRDNIALAMHPNGTLYFAHGDANGLKVQTFNTNTQNWNPATTVQSAAPDKITLRISEEGIPYLSTVTDGKIKVFKYDIP